MTNPTATDVAVQRAVEEVVKALVKALRAVQLYLPNNPMYEAASGRAAAAFTAAWEVTEAIELEVTDSEIRWQGQPMSNHPEETEQIARLLFEDGMRELQFLPGAEQEEILRFLLVLTSVRTLPPDAEDDLLTLLWDEDFLYVRYEAIELGDEEGDAIEPAASSPPDAGAVKEEVAQELSAAEESSNEFASTQDFDGTLYELQPDEIAYLKEEIAREYNLDLRANVLAILFDIFEVQTGHETRHEVIGIFESFLPHLLAARDFDSVIYLLREARAVRARAKDLVAEQGQALEALPRLLLEPDKFGQLLEALEKHETSANEEELERLFRSLPTQSFETALEWLPQLKMERTRALLEDALLQTAISHPDTVTSALASENDTVTLMAVRFAQTLGLPAFVPQLGTLLGHQDLAVRVEVVKSLEAIGSQQANVALERALDDPEREIRIAAIRVIADHKHEGAFGRVEAKVLSGDLKEANLTEKKAFYEAYGVLAGPTSVSQLAPILVPRGFMKRKGDGETRACAAIALGKIGTPEAADALKQADGDKDPMVRSAVRQALTELK